MRRDSGDSENLEEIDTSGVPLPFDCAAMRNYDLVLLDSVAAYNMFEIVANLTHLQLLKAAEGQASAMRGGALQNSRKLRPAVFLSHVTAVLC